MPLPLPGPLQSVLGADAGPVAFDLVSLWRTTGPFARLVVGVLAVMSVYSLAVVAERLVTYARARSASRRFAEALRALLPARRYADAVALSKELRVGYLPRVLGLALEEYEHGLAARARAGAGGPPLDVVAAVDRAVDRSAVRTAAELRRGLSALATIGSTAPFVGLLGTVAGIITAFQSMAASGSGGLASVSAGIAEALFTTALGLLVAIPAVMMFNYLTSSVDEMEVDIADSASELVDYLIKEGPPGR